MSVKICRIFNIRIQKRLKPALGLLRNSSNFYIFTSYELDSISGSSLLALGFRGWKRGLPAFSRVYMKASTTPTVMKATQRMAITAMTAFDSSVFLPSVEISVSVGQFSSCDFSMSLSGFGVRSAPQYGAFFGNRDSATSASPANSSSIIVALSIA